MGTVREQARSYSELARFNLKRFACACDAVVNIAGRNTQDLCSGCRLDRDEAVFGQCFTILGCFKIG